MFANGKCFVPTYAKCAWCIIVLAHHALRNTAHFAHTRGHSDICGWLFSTTQFFSFLCLDVYPNAICEKKIYNDCMKLLNLMEAIY